MVAAKKDFTIEQGSDWVWSLQYVDPVTDLTTYSAALQAKANESDSSSIFTLSSATPTSGIILFADGTMDFHLTAARTTALTTESMVYDLEVTSPSGIITRLIDGNITLSQEVTR
jgi:hypothetical protein